MPIKHPQIEAFLSEIEAQMSEIPTERRQEMLEETRGHLEAMYTARCIDGLSEKNAWEATERAFGDATTIGKSMSVEWKRAPRYETVGEPLTAQDKWKIAARFGLFAGAATLAATLLGDWSRLYHLETALTIMFVAIGLFRTSRRTWKMVGLSNPKKIYSIAFPIILLSLIGVRSLINEPSHLSPMSGFLDMLFIIAIFVTTIAFLWQRKQQEQATLPWRQLPRYASSPIAAEQEYRLNPVLSYVAGGVGFLAISLSYTQDIANLGYGLLALVSVGVVGYLSSRLRR